MYYQYFGLTEAPFSIAVNPRFLYMSPRHRDALAHLLYGVGAGGGFILLTGEVGTGKTTVNRSLLEQLPDATDIAIVLNPALDARDLLASVCEELDIDLAEPQPGLKTLTDGLHRFLLSNHAAGRKTVLMIDEAQHLSFDVLEQIRLLTNLETNAEKLLHIILIGQPELAAKLARPELRQLNQRITARFDLQPLTPDETRSYIRHRLQVAGMPAGRELFTPSLVRAIHRKSRGIPRLINLLCDRMLLGAYGQNSSDLDARLLRRAAREVLGEEQGQRLLPGWALPAVLTIAVAAVAVGLWMLLAAETPDDSAARMRSEAVDVSGSDTAPGAAMRAAARENPVPDAAALPPAAKPWRLSPAEGASLLASLYGAAAAVQLENCVVDEVNLRCERRKDLSWNQLLREGRPALLALLDERRFESTALLLALQDDSALLATASGARRVPLAQLASEWSGDVWQLWRVPTGVSRTLKRGDQGPDVGRVAQLFARLDGQDRALTESLFDERLEERVRLFQAQRGLRADGVMGENTLRALSLAVGEDLGFEEARTFALRCNEAAGCP